MRISELPKDGIGELSRIARKKSPSAPRCRIVAAKLRGAGDLCFGANRFSSIFAIYQDACGRFRAEKSSSDILIASLLFPGFDDVRLHDLPIGTLDEHLVAMETNRNRTARAQLARHVSSAGSSVILADMLHAVDLDNNCGL